MILRLPRARGLALCALLLGCASPRSVVRDVQDLFAREDYAAAAARVAAAKEKDYGRKNAFLFYVDLGMTRHLEGRWRESNEAFESAKKVAEALYTKSVTNEAATFLVSDNVRPYAGEDFERALIHVFSALNYLFLGEGSEALVETRQADYLLTKLQTDFGHKNVYTEDAFVRYLSALVYESQGELNDAQVAYWKALEAYDRYAKDYGVRAPAAVLRGAYRTAASLDFGERVREIQKRWGGRPPDPPPPGMGDVIVLHYAGLPPYKADSFFEIGFAAGWLYVQAETPRGEEQEQVEQAAAIARSILADETVRMAFPKYVPAPYAVRGLEVRAAGAQAGHAADVAEDVGAIAQKSLQDRIARVRAKTIARAVVKYALGRKIAAKVEENRGEAAAWLAKKIFQIAAAATELADKRSWQTLPDKIAVAEVALPAGEHALTLVFRDAAGAEVRRKEIAGVKVAAGRKTFLAVKTSD